MLAGVEVAGNGDHRRAVEEGIAQLCLCLKNFEPSSLPLEQYLYLAPFGRQTLEQVLEIDAAVRKKVPAMNILYHLS